MALLVKHEAEPTWDILQLTDADRWRLEKAVEHLAYELEAEDPAGCCEDYFALLTFLNPERT